MKKGWMIGLIIILSTVLFGYKTIFSNAYINKANEHMEMGGFKLLMSNSPDYMKNKGFINTGGFGCDPYENQNDGIRIVFSGFPDALDDYVITDIETTNPNYYFYDIHTGDDIKKAEDILTNSGFSKVSVNNGSNYCQYKKRKLVVTFDLDEGSKIIKTRINLMSTNKQNVVF